MKAAALRGALSDRGPRRPRARRRARSSTATRPSTKAAVAALDAACPSARNVLVVLERGDEVSVEEPAQPADRCTCSCRRPAEHLRRAGLRRRGLHQGRARGVPRRAGRGKGAKAALSRPRPRPSRRPSDERPSEPAHERDEQGPARHPARARSSPRRATACSTRASTRSSSTRDANKTEIKIAVEKVFGVKVAVGQHAQPPGQAPAHPVRLRQAQGHQARHRDARTTGTHRHLRRSGLLTGHRDDRLRTRTHGYPQVQADDAGSSWLERRRLRRDHAVDAGEVAASVRCTRRAAATTPAASRPVTRVAATSARTASSTSVAHDKDGVAGQGRAHRVRPEPHRAHRAAALRGRREALHHRAEQAAARATRVENGPSRRHQARQQPAAAQHPGRYRHPRHRAAARRRREDRPLGRRQRAARRQGRPLRPAAHALRRDPQRRRALPRHGRRGRQRRAVEHQLGQGRPHALEGQAPDRPRCRHEPDRPPARWW